MEGACFVLLWPGTGVEGGERKRGRKGGRGGSVFRILRAVRHVPCALCEEVTLHPHVPHPLLPGDRCAEHGLQEYRPAAGKGHTEEPPGPRRAQNTHVDTETKTNPIKCALYRFPPTTSPTARISTSLPQWASGCSCAVICNDCEQQRGINKSSERLLDFETDLIEPDANATAKTNTHPRGP